MGSIASELLRGFLGIEKFKVFVLEDNKLFLKGLENQLNKAFQGDIIVKSFETSGDLLNSLSECPHIILMDYHLDDRSKIEGEELIKRLKWSNPSSRIIVLTSEEKSEVAYRCYDCGAENYIIKSIDSIKKVMKEIMYSKDLLKSA